MRLEGIRRMPEEELRTLIRPSGYMVRKAAAIKAFVTLFDLEHGSSLERLAGQPTGFVRRQLLALPGVGEETADAILLYALLQSVAVVDEYLRRITDRHGLSLPETEICRSATTGGCCICPRPRGVSLASLERIPRSGGCRGQATLRPAAPL